jgi:hypothetical protein
MRIPKDENLELLRERGDHDKADQADQELRDQVDHEEHASTSAATAADCDHRANPRMRLRDVLQRVSQQTRIARASMRQCPSTDIRS